MENKQKLNGCGSKNGNEIDGQEFDVDNLKDFIQILQLYKEVHLNYFDGENDLDMWLKIKRD